MISFSLIQTYLGGICKCEGDCICHMKNEDNFTV